MKQVKDNLVILILHVFILTSSLGLCLTALLTDGWSSNFTSVIIGRTTNDETWVLGMGALVLTSIICIIISGIILITRFFGLGRGRAVLGAVISIFGGCFVAFALAIFMAQERPTTTVYKYTFALLWGVVPLQIISGVLFFSMKDDAFLEDKVKCLVEEEEEEGE